MDEDDRISQLPPHILQHKILSLLPQKDAVGTCVLSKSWRHLGPTRPKFEFSESDFLFCKEEFLSVVENTLRGYDDQKISVQEFILEMLVDDSESISLLNKWIPKVITGAKIFNLTSFGFSLPSIVFQAEFLQELFLEGCKFDRIKNNCINVKLPVLKRLKLVGGEIDNETFEKIMSSCPSIQHMVLRSCHGLSSLKVNKARNLKHFDCCGIDSIEINDDAPSLETIRITNCQNQFHLQNNKNNFFPRLKSLILQYVYLTTELLNNLSSKNCPCLEELQLHECYGSTEMKLSNRSIKSLIIAVHTLRKVAIDAANMLYFELRSNHWNFPSIVSFATTSRECMSRIHVLGCSSSDAAWYPKLHEFLKAISQSQISLEISYLLEELPTNQESAYDDGGIFEPLVVVEHLCLEAHYPSSLLNRVFRICRPRYINLPSYSQLTGCAWKTLVSKGETTQCHFWQQDLEESSIRVLDNKTNVYVWRDVHQVCEFPNNDEGTQLRLKWRDSN